MKDCALLQPVEGDEAAVVDHRVDIVEFVMVSFKQGIARCRCIPSDDRQSVLLHLELYDVPPAVNSEEAEVQLLADPPEGPHCHCGVLAHHNDIDGNAIKLLYKPLELECQPGSIFPRSDQQCTLRSGHYVAADNLQTHHILYQKFWSKINTLTSPLEFCFLLSTASESP